MVKYKKIVITILECTSCKKYIFFLIFVSHWRTDQKNKTFKTVSNCSVQLPPANLYHISFFDNLSPFSSDEVEFITPWYTVMSTFRNYLFLYPQ